ncbi:DUF1330 domain-containing protein [Hyphomonas sp.]|uniref:DUF1330 domain-containing protein n=1 Tax=Hyphomonas sp. TaxID=87 RepID=UPI0032429B91
MSIQKSIGAAILCAGLFMAAACTTMAEPETAGVLTPKAYLIAEIEVVNPEPYKEYVAAAGPIVAAYGGKYLVRGGATEALEGAPPAGRMVVVEFPSMADAKRFYDSPEYTDVRQGRIENAISRFILVEGPAP